MEKMWIKIHGQEAEDIRSSCRQATPEYLARLEEIKQHKELYFDFAREVIGWQFPQWHGDNFFNPNDPHKDIFAPHVTDNVLMHVQNWCDTHDTGFSLVYGHTEDTDTDYSAMVNGWEVNHVDLRIALLDACLNAERERAQEHKVQP